MTDPAEKELSTVLDADRTAAVIEHRKKLKKPLTAYAAKLLAKKLGQAKDPNEAADTMILHGWLGFEVEWVENRKQKGNGATPTTYIPRGVVKTWAEIKAERER